MNTDKTPPPEELEALARKHGATSYRNRADTQHPAYGFTEDGLRNLLADALAKWGSPVVAGEPVAEMVPFHTPSGKRVAVISRFQHLPIGTKLYAHPQPAAQDAEDAKRYRWLRRNAIGAFRTNDGKGPVSVYHLCKIPAIPGIPEETDAAIDAAIAAQQGRQP